MTETVLTGIPAAPGIAIGEVFLFRHDVPEFREYGVDDKSRQNELRRLEEAVVETRRQLSSLRIRMAKIAGELSPDEIQINTPLRPCAVKPLPSVDITEICKAFSKLRDVISVYDASPPQTSPLDTSETQRRRPVTETG